MTDRIGANSNPKRRSARHLDSAARRPRARVAEPPARIGGDMANGPYRDMLEASNNGHYRCDLENSFVYANPAMARLHGFDTVEAFVSAMGPKDCLQDPDATRRFFANLVETGALHGVKNTRLRAGGDTFESWETAQCRYDGRGRCVAIDGLVVDISASRFLDDKLRLSEHALVNKIEQLQHILDSMEQGVCVYDSENHLVGWNKPFRELIGTLGNLAVMGVLGPGDPQKLARAELKRITSGDYDDVEIERAHDGRVFEIRRYRLDDGGHLVTYTDVTERDRTRDALQAAREIAEIANRSKTNYIGFLGHEFRTPLNTVLAFAEMLTDPAFHSNPERVAEYSRYIHDSGTMLLNLLNDVLDLSRLEAGETDIQAEKLDARNLFEDMNRMIGLEFEKRGIAYAVNVPDHCPPLYADQRSAKQIILNLLTNAAKHTPKGGSVRVNARPEANGEFMISVQDTGHGIAKESIPGLLNPFSRSAEDLKVTAIGSGLGLPICKYLMDMHGGRIEIDSALNRGTTVRLYFPGSKRETDD